jgi:probable HAF family extracellular repeat protein
MPTNFWSHIGCAKLGRDAGCVRGVATVLFAVAVLSACGGGDSGVVAGDSSVVGRESIARVDPGARAEKPPVYHVIDIGTLGGTTSAAHAINDRGQITGESELRVFDGGYPNVHAFRYSDGTMLDLGTLPRANLGEVIVQSSYGYGINIWGQVTGMSNISEQRLQAFVYSHGAMQNLGVPSQSYGSGINARGQISGTKGEPGDHAFLYSDGVVEYIGTLGGPGSSARAINDRGDVTGESTIAPPVVPGAVNSHAFLYRDGIMKDLGTLGGTYSNGIGINAKGLVTGISTLAGEATGHAFLYEGTSMRDLGTLGGYYSFGLGISAAGQVVGSSQTYGYENSHAFLWSKGTLHDLNNLLDKSGDPWTLISAEDINGRGQIVGTGLINGQRHGFLLTPVDRDDHEGQRKDRHDGHWSYSEHRQASGADGKAVADGRLDPLCLMEGAEMRSPSRCKRH